MIFAKRVFQAAGIYGIVAVALGYGAYFLSGEAGTAYADRPEYVHGFFLVTFAWQIAFLIIASDPVRFRLLMLAAILEKFPFTLAAMLLYAAGQVPATILAAGLIDGALGVFFAIAYIATDGPADGE
jgi:hypothetical protein